MQRWRPVDKRPPPGPLTAGLTNRAVTLAAQGVVGPDDEARSVAALGAGWVAEEAPAIGLLAALAGKNFI